MKIKLGNLQYYMLIGLIAGVISGLLVNDAKVSKITTFISCVFIGCGAGTFIGLLKSAGTRFRTGLKAALYGSLFWIFPAILLIFESGVASFFVCLVFGLIVFESMFISLSLSAVFLISIRRIKVRRAKQRDKI